MAAVGKRGGWSSVMGNSGALCVTTFGITEMPPWCADTWGFLQMALGQLVEVFFPRVVVVFCWIMCSALERSRRY